MGKTVASWIFFTLTLFLSLLYVFFWFLSIFCLFLRIKFLFNWDVAFPLVLLHPLLETMLLSKSMISRIFWNLIDFGFKKMMKKYRLTSEGNGGNHAHKTIINTIYMKPDIRIIKKIVRKLWCKCTLMYLKHVNVP